MRKGQDMKPPIRKTKVRWRVVSSVMNNTKITKNKERLRHDYSAWLYLSNHSFSAVARSRLTTTSVSGYFFKWTFRRELNQLFMLNILSMWTIYWRLTRKNSLGLSCFSNSSSEYEIFSLVPFFIYRHTFRPSNATWLMSFTETET